MSQIGDYSSKSMAVLSAGSSDEQILGVVDHWAELLVEGRFEEAREVVTINHEVIERAFNMYISGREFLGPKASGRNLRLAVHRAARDQPCGRAISRTESTPELSFNYEASVFYELPLLGEWSSGTPAGDWNARISFLILVEPVADGLALELVGVRLRALRAADLEPLIRAQFPPKQGWLARQEDSDPTISELELLDDGGYFSNHILLRINVQGRFLETEVLPHGGSLGVFASDHTNLRYLSGKSSASAPCFDKSGGRSLASILTSSPTSALKPYWSSAMTPTESYGRRTTCCRHRSGPTRCGSANSIAWRNSSGAPELKATAG